jgi:hypothetical protein
VENFNNKVIKFANILQAQQIERLKKDGLDCPNNITNAHTSIKIGSKYTKVDIGTGGRYMVDNATGTIYGIKAYGVIHKGHSFGTLDTVDSYYWGNYTGGVKI